jgi:glycine/D-amino acid oxidase-like deaminating enzyme
MDIVIIGSGIIGVSTAYYLSQLSQTPGTQIHLIESTPHLFASASGYAGGFLAKDWFTPAASALGALSFDLHKQLADKHGGREKWAYCPSTALSMTVDDSARKSGRRGEDWLFQGTSRAEVARTHPGLETMNAAPPWMTRLEGGSVDVIGSGETTAQV